MTTETTSNLGQFMSSNQQLSSSSSSQSSSSSLLLKLINETYISLPIASCLDVDLLKLHNQSLPTNPQEAYTSGRHKRLDACLINWNEARLYRGSISSSQGELYLMSRNLSDFSGLNATNDNLIERTKLIYLTFSSALSVVGVLTNLLIVLVILINSKQKFCNHFLSRTSNTCHDYILLSQLALTGLLIAGYVLLDDFRLLQRHSNASIDQIDQRHEFISHLSLATLANHCPPSNLRITNRTPMYCGDQNNINPYSKSTSMWCSPSWSWWSSSPLSAMFLPPMPLDLLPLHQHDNHHALRSPQVDSENTNGSSSASENNSHLMKTDEWVLMLKFKTRKKQTTANNVSENPQAAYYVKSDSYGPQQDNVEQVANSVDESSRLYDLSRVLKSIKLVRLSAGSDDCRLAAECKQPNEETRISSLVMNLMGVIHIWTVAALAYDRHCAIAHPLEYLRTISPTKSRLFILILWALSITLTILLPLKLSHTPSGVCPDAEQRHEHSSSRELAVIFSELSTKLYSSESQQTPTTTTQFWSMIINISLSMISFVSMVMTPLIVISVCNIRIYGIVKIHERRLSHASSSSQGGGGGQGGASSGCHYINGQRSVYANHHHRRGLLDDTKSDIVSIGSSIYDKIVRASAQISLLRSISRHDLSSLGGASADANNNHNHEQNSADKHTEYCRLISTNDKCDCLLPNRQQQQQQPQHVISRSPAKRMAMSRQDSYNLMRLASQKRQSNGELVNVNQCGDLLATAGDSDTNCKQVAAAAAATAESRARAHLALKRKTSDNRTHHSFGHNQHHFHHHTTFRKDSFASQLDYSYASPFDLTNDTCMCCNNNNKLNNTGTANNHQLVTTTSNKNPNATTTKILSPDSDGIMHQLKMAGLSFAGIAINDNHLSSQLLQQNSRHRHLSRSSSCSLGNISRQTYASSLINNNQRFRQSPCQQTPSFMVPTSISRCSMDTCASSSASQHVANRTNHPARMQADNASRCCQWNNPDSYLINQSEHSDILDGHNNSQANHPTSHSRLPLSLGTKSLAFNAVIWIVLLILISIVAQYLLAMLVAATSSGLSATGEHQRLDGYKRSLSILLATITNDQQSYSSQPTSVDWLDMSLTWTTCLCRLLFLLMLPLNGWLYGIRSRSLKTTVKMVLKRYISRRQATIEIDQRQKSSMLSKSRDSSFLNQPYYCTNTTISDTQQVEQNDRRYLRRCSSFGGSRREISSLINATMVAIAHEEPDLKDNPNSNSLGGAKSQLADQKSSHPLRTHNNSIRFVIQTDLQNRAENKDQSDQTADNYSPLSPSLHGSHRSLLSESIKSSQSAAFLLLDKKQLFEETIEGQPTKPSGVLKHNNTASNGNKSNRRLSNTFWDRTSSLDCYDEQQATIKRTQNVGDLKVCRDDEYFTGSDGFRTLPSIINDQNTLALKKGEQQADESGKYACQVLRKSSSEIRFMLTTGDNVDPRPLDLNSSRNSSQEKEEPDSPLDLNNASKQELTSTDPSTLPTTSGQINTPGQPALLSSWCKHIKEKLGRYLPGVKIPPSSQIMTNQMGAKQQSVPNSPGSCTSTSLILANETQRMSIDSDELVMAETSNGGRFLFRKFSDTSTGSTSSNQHADSRSGSPNKLARRSSLDSHRGPTWRPTSATNCNDLLAPKTKMRNSMTATDVTTGTGCRCCKHKSDQHLNSASFVNNNYCQNSHHRSPTTTNNSPVGGGLSSTSGASLKPPSFLKLIFDPDTLYMSTLALSPIRECSSNHSYASSQSSLTNQVTLPGQPQQQQQSPPNQQQPLFDCTHMLDEKSNPPPKPSIIIYDSNKG